MFRKLKTKQKNKYRLFSLSYSLPSCSIIYTTGVNPFLKYIWGENQQNKINWTHFFNMFNTELLKKPMVQDLSFQVCLSKEVLFKSQIPITQNIQTTNTN